MTKLNNLFWMMAFIFLLGSVTVYSVTDSDTSNNVLNVSVNVVDKENLHIIFRPVDSDPDSNFNSNVEEFVKVINKTYPIADSNFTYEVGKKYDTGEDQKGIIELSWTIFRLNMMNTLVPSTTRPRTVGVVPKDWFLTETDRDAGTYGWAVVAGPKIFPGVIAEGRGNRIIAAHEIAHTFGLCDEHTSSVWAKQDGLIFTCPNGDKDDNNALDANCTGIGCEFTTLANIVPWNNGDGFMSMRNLMGNGSNDLDSTWISPESYGHLLDKFDLDTNKVTGSTSLVINGRINKSDGTIEMFSSYVIEDAILTQDDLNDSGNYSLEIIDINGVVTSKINFTPSFYTMSFNGTTEETNISFFIAVMNFSANDKGYIVREIGIQKNSSNKSTNTPTLSINTTLQNTLISNNFTLAYNSTDADNNTIYYAILISSDNGNTYSTLEIDHPNETLFINTSGYTESQQYKVKILATDGINTNTTVSEGVFEIDNDLRITNLSILDENQTKRTFFYVANNTLGNTLNNIKEELDTGETTVELTTNHSLAPEEDIMVFIEYNYSSGGDKTVTATAISGSYIETESTSISIPHVEVRNLTVLSQSGTEGIFEVIIVNNLLISLTNVNWTFDSKNSNVINSTSTVILQPNEEMFIYLDYNFTTTGTFNVNATAKNGTLIDSRNLTILIT